MSAIGESPPESYSRVMNTTALATRDRQPNPLAFRRARRSAVGWAAVLAPGWVAGIAVAVATMANGRPGPGRVLAAAGGGALAGVLLARGLDELQWRRQPVSLEVAEPDAALDLMQAVRAEGVRADMVRADHRKAEPAYALRYRAKDDRRVRAVLAEQQG